MKQDLCKVRIHIPILYITIEVPRIHAKTLGFHVFLSNENVIITLVYTNFMVHEHE